MYKLRANKLQKRLEFQIPSPQNPLSCKHIYLETIINIRERTKNKNYVKEDTETKLKN